MKNWEAYLHILHFKMLEFYPVNIRRAFSAATLPGRIWRFFKYYLAYFKAFLFNLFYPQIPLSYLENKCWFFVSTKNQRDCLLPCKKQISNSVFVGTGFTLESENIQTLSLGNRWLYTHLYSWIWGNIWRIHPAHAIRYFDYIMMTMGTYECFLQHLKKYRPQAIVLANDHNFIHRSLLFAAKQLNIPTIYIQHAAISTYFPPLQFDLSLLEGQDTLDKYKICGPIHGEVALVGMAKFDGYEHKRNQNTRVEKVGICCGPLDDLDTVTALVHRLVGEIPNVQFTFRKHPRDKRTFDFDALSQWLSISNPTQQKPLDFLCTQDLIVAGNSSIHLEAVLLNVESVYISLDPIEHGEDYYGFVKNGLSLKAENAAQVVTIIQQKQREKDDVFPRAKYYNHLVSTASEGKSTHLIIEYMKEYIDQGTVKALLKDGRIEVL